MGTAFPRGTIQRAVAIAGGALVLLGLAGDLQDFKESFEGFDQEAFLDFLGLEFEGEREDVPAEGGGEQADQAFVEQAEEVVVNGTRPYVMGGWSQWNRIYYRPKGQTSGSVMLLVERVGKAADQIWTCVDPTLKVQLVCLKKKIRPQSLRSRVVM